LAGPQPAISSAALPNDNDAPAQGNALREWDWPFSDRAAP